MLFGNQPFIADMTAEAVARGSPVAAGMAARFSARAKRLEARLHAETTLRVHRPEAGMFAMVDVSSTGMGGSGFAMDLLHRSGVAVMPGSSFGESLTNWVRLALTIPDDDFDEALNRIIAHVTQPVDVSA